MLTHANIWAAIDALAGASGLSVSGLARRAGLDPTTFNKSKRISRDGKPRWPSTESIAKILQATQKSLPEFVQFVADCDASQALSAGKRLPILAQNQAHSLTHFDTQGQPRGAGWEEIAIAGFDDAGAFAIEITDDAMAPIIAAGRVVIAATGREIRRGDQVLLALRNGSLILRVMMRQNLQRIELEAHNRKYDTLVLNNEDVVWKAQILWVGQF